MATVKVFKYKFGNYLDTRVANVSDLEAHFNAIDPVDTFNNINFSFNDGLNATIVLPINDSDINEINYLIVEVDNEIKPYFILSYVYNLQNQYTLALKYDSVLANLEIIKASTANVDRAFILDTDKRIYNNEGIEVTQIKQYEIPLQRTITSSSRSAKEDIGWYAVFADAKLGSTNDAADKLVLRAQARTITASATYASRNDIPFKDYIDNDAYYLKLDSSNILQNVTYYKSGPPKPHLGIGDTYSVRVHSNKVQTYSNHKYTAVYTPGVTTYNYSLDNQDAFDYIVNRVGARDSYTHPGIVLPSSGADLPEFDNDTLINNFNTLALDYNNKQFQKNIVAEVDEKAAGTLLSNNNKIISVAGKLYKVVVNLVYLPNEIVFSADAGDNITYLRSKMLGASPTKPKDPTANALNIYVDNITDTFNGDLSIKYPTFDVIGTNNAHINHIVTLTKITVTLEEVNAFTNSDLITFDGSSTFKTLEATTIDAPYKILLFPYGNIAYFKVGDPSTAITPYSKALLDSVISNLIDDYGGGTSPRIFDVQKIPYSTVDLEYNSNDVYNGYITIEIDAGFGNEPGLREGSYYVNKDNEGALVFFNAITSTREFDINLPDMPKNDVKLDSITKTARITSNSLKTNFEFDYVKNKYKSSFRVSVDLKPINSYFNIDLIADEEGLYYTNFADGRGLNIAEDFSVTQMTDVFMAYQRENFNYLNSFNAQQNYQDILLDRQQANQDAALALQQRQSWAKLGVNAGTNVLIATGAGLMTGGVVGAAAGFAGGLIKTGIDAASNALAISHNRQSLALNQAQARDLLSLDQAQARQQFDFKIKNITSLPHRLDKVSGITVLDKITPFISVYGTTIEEEERLTQFFKFNAYNINSIDILNDYIDIRDESYVKATIIRGSQPISNVIMQDINTRLASGVYFIKET